MSFETTTNTGKKLERVIETIKKLFAVAANNPNEGEAKNAMLLAQKMMAKHHIEMKDLAADPVLNPVTNTVIHSAPRFPFWQTLLLETIAHEFRCYAYHETIRKTICRLRFVGRAEDIKIAETVFIFAVTVAKELAQINIRSRGDTGATRRAREAFLMGFSCGVREAFQKQKEENKEGWGLVLVPDSEVKKEWAQISLHFRTMKKTTSTDNSAYQSGYAAGRNFNPNPSGFLHA